MNKCPIDVSLLLLAFNILLSIWNATTTALRCKVVLDSAEQVVEEGSVFNFTCRCDKMWDSLWFSAGANSIFEIRENHRFQRSDSFGEDKNGRFYASTLTIANATTKDTGYYTCLIEFRESKQFYEESASQYIYVSGEETVIFAEGFPNKQLEYIHLVGPGVSDIIPCKPTHPNVTIALFRLPSRNVNKEQLQTYDRDLLSGSETKWSMDPKQGLILKNPTIDDNDIYYCEGHMGLLRSGIRFTVVVYDLKVEGNGDDRVVEEGDNVTLLCGSFNFNQNIEWSYWKKSQFSAAQYGVTSKLTVSPLSFGFELKNFTSGWILTNQLIIYNFTRDSYNSFRCKSNFSENTVLGTVSKEILLQFKAKTDLNPERVEMRTSTNLTCTHPNGNAASIQWRKNKKRYSGNAYSCINLSILPLHQGAADEGFYECISFDENDVEVKTIKAFRVVFVEPEINTATTVALSVISVLAFVMLIALGIKYVFDSRRQVFPGAENLLNATGATSPYMPIEDQTHAMSYDKRWEFPRNRLRLGNQIGSGCFGRVLIAEAIGIRGSNQTMQTVAVKMIKSPIATAFSELEALVAELKILTYLEPHMNVVNLLGACTKQIANGELLVILEYCRFGNLLSVLNDTNNTFIDQLDDQGRLKPSQLERHSMPKSDDAYTVLGPNAAERIRSNCPSVPTFGQEMSDQPGTHRPRISISQIRNSAKMSQNVRNNSCASSIAFSTRDLISWSWQIARGMKHLASKKVVHGDLAARNVLLTEEGVVKVADFGMARKMYYSGQYQKKGQGPLPLKWMAIESVTNGIFTSQSDVWSYGVLLWELFSLGQAPYPGMKETEMLDRLNGGYRMQKPKNAPEFIGKIMNKCWEQGPADRPTFDDLDTSIYMHLETTISSYYLRLDSPFAYPYASQGSSGECMDNTKLINENN